MARNKIAGSTRGTSATARYYQKNAKARAVKDRYNKNYHSTPKRRKYRSKLNKAARGMKVYGKRWKMGKDLSHKKNGRLIMEKSSTNRARNRSKK
jgi:hypothetical protein